VWFLVILNWNDEVAWKCVHVVAPAHPQAVTEHFQFQAETENAYFLATTNVIRGHFGVSVTEFGASYEYQYLLGCTFSIDHKQACKVK